MAITNTAYAPAECVKAPGGETARVFAITTAQGRTGPTWTRQSVTWEQFCESLRKPIQKRITLDQYRALDGDKKGWAKDGPCFVGGRLSSNTKRGKKTLIDRDLIVLDADNIKPDGRSATGLAEIQLAVAALGRAFALYTTPTHTPQKPRARIVFPLSRSVSPQEYEAIARRIANLIDPALGDPERGTCVFDATTFEPERLMYFPAVFGGGQYYELDNLSGGAAGFPPVDADAMLEAYGPENAWCDCSRWPGLSAQKIDEHRKFGQLKASPLKSSNPWVRAFCTTYNIREAIEAFLSDVYGFDNDGRVQLLGGSRADGCLIFDYADGAPEDFAQDQFFVSYHNTDPTQGQEVNAFDLVRIWKFGEADKGIDPKTRPTSRPSFGAMVQWIKDELPEVVDLAAKFTALAPTTPQDDFSGVPHTLGRLAVGVPADGENWRSKADLTEVKGVWKSTIENVKLILRNDPGLSGRIGKDTFSGNRICVRPLPWDYEKNVLVRPGDAIWNEAGADDAQLRAYLSKHYGIKGDKIIDDGVAIVADLNQFNAVADWLNGLEWDGEKRLETMLIDYFGVEDDPAGYVRAATRKMMMAAVRRARLDIGETYKFDNVLTFIGEQGAGKSTFFKKLLQSHPRLFSDQMKSLDDKNKDNQITMQGFLIMELGELNALRKADREAAKKVITAECDTYREPYGKVATAHPRRCVLIGTGNVFEFLNDPTGGRRFWPIDIPADYKKRRTKSIWDDLTADVAEQIWAEAVVFANTAERTDMDTPELQAAAARAQEAHNEENPLAADVMEFLDREVPADWDSVQNKVPVWPLERRRAYWAGGDTFDGATVERDSVTITEILLELFPGRYPDAAAIQPKDSAAIRDVLTALPGWNFDSRKVRHGPYGIVRVWKRQNAGNTD